MAYVCTYIRSSALVMLSLVQTCEPNAHVYGWDCNALHAICEQFAYHSPQTKICQVFVRTQRELGVFGVLCSPQVRGKLSRAQRKLFASRLVCMWFVCVHWPLQCYITCQYPSTFSVHFLDLLLNKTDILICKKKLCYFEYFLNLNIMRIQEIVEGTQKWYTPVTWKLLREC